MKEIIKRPRGTIDYYGENGNLLSSVMKILLKESELYGCEYCEVPLFEETRLFHRSVGEGSDIVRKETFDLVKKGDKDYTLRPEFTASINRMVIENKIWSSPDLPLRFSYFGPVFRYERPQSGRLRQFYQYGCEFFDNKIDIDASLDAILLAITSAEKVLKHEITLKINYLGSLSSRENYKKALYDYFAPQISSMCEDCKERLVKNPLRILDCKVEEDQKLCLNAPKITDYLIEEDKEEFKNLLSALDSANIKYVLDPSLVRGLDYYTGVVFELYDSLDFPAIGGGGKYSSLMSDLGGPDFEGIGFSLGVDRLLMRLSDDEKAKLVGEDLDILFIDMKKDGKALSLVNNLRKANYSLRIASLSRSLTGALKMADRLHAKYVIIYEDEIKVKDLKTREQRIVNEEDIISYLGEKDA